ncbi:MAG: hypothetical protein AAFR16_04720 [Pseudomonadota bacterium]
MAIPPRLKPDPIPTIRPTPEHLAEGELKATYEDVKGALRAPWMGVVAMAFAHHRGFFDALWRGFRPIALSAPFAEACAEVRAAADAAAARLSPAPIRAALAGEGYAPRELAEIDAVLEVFARGNPPYALMATWARLALEGHPLEGPAQAAAHAGGGGANEILDRLTLMERHHADPETRAVYDAVMDRLGLPFVNTDYRALARWPSCFARAWGGLSPLVDTPAYAAEVDGIHARLAEAALALPNPTGMRPEALQAAAGADGSLEETLAVVRLFQWLLPGLLTNVAVFQAQLRAA